MPIDPNTGRQVERLYPAAGSDEPAATPKNPPPPTQGPVLNAPTLPPATGGTAPPVFGNDVQFSNKASFSPTTAPYGMDMSMPGYQQQFWDNNQQLWMNTPQLDWVDSMLPQFQSPWAGEQINQGITSSIGNPGAGQQYWNSIRGTFNTMTPAQMTASKGYNGPNNAQSAFGLTQSRVPGSFQPQFDAYYDRMKDKVMSDVNSQSAARGVYGGSSALNNSIGAGLDVEAQRAKAATDFMFSDSQNQLQWLNSLSNQGRAADLSGQGAFGLNLQAGQDDLNRIRTFGDLAFRSEEADLARKSRLSDIAFGLDEARGKRVGSGIDAGLALDSAYSNRLNNAMGAAGRADDERSGRINTLYNQVSGMSNDVQDFFMDNYNALLGGNQAMGDAQLQSMIAQYADQRGWDQQTRDQVSRDITGALDLYTGIRTNAET